MAITMKPIPSVSSGMSKLKRATPEFTSVPTSPSNKPRKIMPMALSSEPEASTTAPIKPSTIKEKYSAGPNLKATSVKGTAKAASTSVPTQPAKNEPSPALAAAGLGSFFAGCVGTLVLAAFAVPLTEVAFKFGPAEYFSLMVLGLIGAVVLASGSLLKAVGMILLGLLLGLVGTDVNSGVARFSFDVPELTDGIGFIVIAMGVFGYGEIIMNLGKHESEREVFTANVKGLMPTKQDFKRMVPAVLRGTALGAA